jgi:hypothetical protein
MAKAACGLLMLGALAATAQTKKAVTWHDDYTNTVTATNVSKNYPEHEKNIPESVIAEKMKTMESAQTVWASQNGKVRTHVGNVAAGKITVVVDFGYIVDTHEYVRDPK